jgi:hypothetical protein
MPIDKAEVTKDVSWLGARLREPSTYLGLSALLAAFHLADASSWVSALTSLGIGIGGIIGIVLPEGRSGPVKPAMTNPTTSILALGIIVFALAAMGGPALAQQKKATPAPAAEAGQPCILFHFVDGCKQVDGTTWHAAAAPGGKLEPLTVWKNIKNAINTKVQPDISYADAVAKLAATAQSKARSLCYEAILGVAQQTAQAPKDAGGNALPMPDPAIVSTMELALEDLEQAEQVLAPNSSLMVTCQAGASATGTDLMTFINGIATGALALPKLGIAIPALP